MAVDDIINGISGDNAVLEYQPAAGVESIVTIFFTTSSVALYNGTNFTVGNTATSGRVSMGITNTRWVRVPAQGAGNFGGYSAIQVK